MDEIHTVYVSDGYWKDDTYRRGGIIPYLRHGKDIFMCLSIDSQYKTLIDLGGTREDFDCCVIATALRECRKESLGIFGNWEESDLSDCRCVVREKVVLVLVPVDTNMQSIREEFLGRLPAEENPEAVDLRWIHQSDLENVTNDTAYHRIVPQLQYISGLEL